MQTSKLKEMEESKKALLKIFSSILYLTRQGLAIRGHTDENSNLQQLLTLRSEDSCELKNWLSRTKYKWISHEVQNEMISLLSKCVQKNLIGQIKNCKYYSIILDETTDSSCKEQVSICFRIFDKKLNVFELFLGFFETKFTDAATLYSLLTNVLSQFELDLSDCRGQCYDGAANVSGHITGLQKRINNVEPRALYVHCSAHTLNLVVQDSMMTVERSRDFLVLLKSLIVFVRNSPKRQSIFNDLQVENNLPSKSLRPFCPTRWCMRIVSLKTVSINYETIIEFLKTLSNEKSKVGAIAKGFLKKITKFDFLFLTNLMISIFDRVELLNAELQRVTLSFQEAQNKIKNVRASIQEQRNIGFDTVWYESKIKSNELGLKEKNETRIRKPNKRFIEGSESHIFSDIQDEYRALFYEIIDVTLVSLDRRFQKNVIEHLSSVERFIIGKETSHKDIIQFYGSDFDGDKLKLHRDMFLDVAKSRNVPIKNAEDVLKLIRNDDALSEMLPELKKLLCIMLVIPVSSCTSERSFSALRRLKTYIRSTMSQPRLNDISLLHVHHDEELNLDIVANEFINNSKVRKNTFAI